MSDSLTPPPRRLERLGGSLRLRSAALRPTTDPGHRPAADRLEEGLRQLALPATRGEPSAGQTPIRLLFDPAAAPAGVADERQAYRLEITAGGITIASPGEPGLYYGAETLLQWLAAHRGEGAAAPAEVPAVRIEDGPGFRHRGYLLDISRNRVPTLEHLLRTVDQMAALKLNQLQLYMEHTFAYAGHEVVWRDSSPLTADEVRTLDAHCRRRLVELVPNQNSFGHLHHWLRHQPYRRLAEQPEGTRHPFGTEIEPFSLCPIDPGAIDLLRDLYGQLLPLFTSDQLNVGCDETFDLGEGRSAAACRELGKGQVYLGFLRQLHALAAEHGRRIQFWGDILASHPHLLGEAPADAVVLEWGYEAGHRFDDRAAALAAAGLEFYLCPGTSGWNSFAGRLDNALVNLAEAARSGAAHGASGYLITEWGDWGHLQPPPVSWPPLVAGAAFAWSPDAAADPFALPLAALVDRFGEPGLVAGTGEVLVALGNSHRETGVTPFNASALFKLVMFADRTLADAGLGALTAAGLERAESAVNGAMDRLAALAPGGEAGGLVRRELAWLGHLLTFACRLGKARLTIGGELPLADLPRAERRNLARLLDRVLDELAPLWLARSRPGGLDASRQHLQRTRRLLSA